MTAAALLLMYQIALALFVGLGPIFILCLIFEQTKPLFHKWLMYGIATLFSLAVLNFVVSLVLGLTLRVAAALWASDTVNKILGISAEGFSNQALEQGGLGLLMTVLILSTPPMAAAFFNATLGQFYTYSGINPGGSSNIPGPQGQPPGSYTPQPVTTPVPTRNDTPTNWVTRAASSSPSAQQDAIKPPPQT
jgi:type IV secretion system protein VirB6